MHELPEGLTISLRSWRGSIYSNAPTFRVRSVPSDLEKGPQDDGDDTVLVHDLSRPSKTPPINDLAIASQAVPSRLGRAASPAARRPASRTEESLALLPD